MHAHVTRLADVFAMLGGAILFVIVMVTTTNTGAFILDRIVGLFGLNVSGLPGYEDFVQLAISGAALMFFPYTQASRGHVAVDLFVANAPMPVKRVLDHMWLTLTAAIALFLAYWMFHGMLESRSDAAEAGVLGWPIWPFYLPGIASMVLWAVVSVSQIFGDTRYA
ncbi:TRAP transporter small permease [Celeribacter litoreus]|uniref:TRAP transporter small permease n=1 Tax=Celeribacter litoreus TaxID=2876714 RepID=UPI001CCCDE88|nr:TRAP transporter small permease [Celeribacter litoreus]MCA0042888.1 TRAP transporter small permease [Celeribacter litoreus]